VTEPVVLHELDRTGVIRSLDSNQAAALAATALVELRPDGGGRWRLLPNGRVGALRMGGLYVQVRPKIGISRLLFLLGYAKNPGFLPEDVDGIAEPDLWPALAQSLARQAERALHGGVLQGYVTFDEALPLVRGRIRLADQFARRPGVFVPLEVRYDEYAADIVENQILRSALRRMTGVPGLDPAARARLGHLDARLDGVQVLPYGEPTPSWRLTRLNVRYATALRLAEVVLRNQSAEPGPGGHTIAAFVVEMADVFEDFVTTALREALAPYPGHTDAQRRHHLDERQRIVIKPDIIHVINGQPAVVFDAKYKLQHATSRYPNADAYQMLAYCTALGLPTGWLVYAQGTSAPGTFRIRNTGIDVVQYPLDLAAHPRDLLSQVDALASTAIYRADQPGQVGDRVGRDYQTRHQP
jgi:5-methylcytosine-specific restriction enzyme subunit McrC